MEDNITNICPVEDNITNICPVEDNITFICPVKKNIIAKIKNGTILIVNKNFLEKIKKTFFRISRFITVHLM